MSVGDRHVTGPDGRALCTASGPLLGYNETSQLCRTCASLENSEELSRAPLSAASGGMPTVTKVAAIPTSARDALPATAAVAANVGAELTPVDALAAKAAKVSAKRVGDPIPMPSVGVPIAPSELKPVDAVVSRSKEPLPIPSTDGVRAARREQIQQQVEAHHHDGKHHKTHHPKHR